MLDTDRMMTIHRRLTLWLIACLCVIGFGSCAPGWRTFTSADDGFSVSIPGSPEVISGPWEEMRIVGNWRWYRVIGGVHFWNLQPVMTYMIGVGRLPTAAVADDARLAAVEFLRKEYGQSMTSAEVVTVDGAHSTGIEFREGRHAIRARVVSVVDRLFIAVYMGPADRARHNEHGERFFSSLSVTK